MPDCFSKIEYELEHAIDSHSKTLIVSNIELFLQDAKGSIVKKTFQLTQWIEFDGIGIRVICLDQLIEVKKASGRQKYLDGSEKAQSQFIL